MEETQTIQTARKRERELLLRLKLLTVTGLSFVVPTATNCLINQGTASPAVPSDPPASDSVVNVSEIEAVALDAAREHQVDPKMVLSIIAAESCFQRDAVSTKGALGLMQIKPETARDLGYDARKWRENVVAGTRYIGILLSRYRSSKNSFELALAAYNAGPAAVTRYNGVPPFKETRRYVRRVLDYYRSAQRHDGRDSQWAATALLAD